MTLIRIAPQAGTAGAGVPTGGTAGQVLTKNTATNYDTAWAAASGGGGMSAKVKTASLSRSSTATPAIDPDLQIAITATGTYSFTADLVAYCPVGSVNLSIAGNYTGTVGANYCGSGAYFTNGSFQDGSLGSANFNVINLNAAIYTPIKVIGMFVATGTGTVSIFWSQGTSNANAVRLQAGGVLQLIKTA